jgi:hypothetical protein
MKTIITVITPRHLEMWLLNVEKICKRNSNLQNLQIITVFQKGMQGEIPQLKKKLEVISNLPKYLFVSNQEVVGIPEGYKGSYEHAIGLITGLQSIDSKGIIYVIDPDFFILQDNWLEDTARYLESSHSGYAGAMYDPSDVKQWMDFPCLHFFLFTERNVQEFIQNLMPNLVPIESKVKGPYFESLIKKLSSSGELGFELRLEKMYKSAFVLIQNDILLPFIVPLATYCKAKSSRVYSAFYRILISIGIRFLRRQQKKQGVILVHGATKRSKNLLREMQKEVKPIMNSRIAYRVLILEQQARMSSYSSDFTWTSGVEVYFLDEILFAIHLRSFRNKFEDVDLSDLEMLLLK